METSYPTVSQLRRVYLSVFFASVGLGHVYLIPAFAEQLGATYLELGFIGTVRSIPYAFLPVIVGYLGDRFGRPRLYLVSIFLTGAATITLASASTINEIVLVQVLLGIGFSLFWPLSEALVSEAAPVQKRTAALGLYAVAWACGFLIGPLVGGVVADIAGFQVAFLVAGIDVLITAGVSVAIIRSSWQKVVERMKTLTPQRELLYNLLPMMTAQIPYGIVFAFIVSIFPGYAAQLGLTPFEVGVLVSGFGFARIVMFSLSGKLEHFGEVKSIMSAFVGLALVMIVIPLNRGFIVLLTEMCAAGIFIGAIYPQTIGYISKHSPSTNLGFVLGLYETIFGIGFAIGPLASGFVAQVAGLDLAYVFLALVSISAVPMFLFTKRNR